MSGEEFEDDDSTFINNDYYEEISREWSFILKINAYDLNVNEHVGIIGNSSVLGEWKIKNAIPMKYNNSLNSWQITIELPQENQDIQYRYFIYSHVPNCECDVLDTNKKCIGDNVIVRYWETHLVPRIISTSNNNRISNDIFGLHDTNMDLKIDRGWLTIGAIIQFKFFNSPFYWKKEHRIVFVKIVPMLFSIPHGTTQICLSPLKPNESAVAFVEVSNMKFNNCVMNSQSEYGIRCGPNDLVIFHVTVSHPETVAYVVDLYVCDSKNDPFDPPSHLGCHCILPTDLTNNKFPGKLEMPIMCTCCDKKLGAMDVQYTIVRPLHTTYVFDMSASYQRYWKKFKNCLDIAHYGSGSSFKYKKCMIRQNTIASFRNAVDHGADMIYFTVVVSKDGIPFVYHDFNVYVSEQSKNRYTMKELKSFPISELEYGQILNLRLFHLTENDLKYKQSEFGNEDIMEHKPFPKLHDILELIDQSMPFVIEIKWPQQYIDGSWETEVDNSCSFDPYIDQILKTLLHGAGKRKIVLSSLHPDICVMLRYKQNIWPVMFITQGKSKRLKLYKDPRCHSIETALCHSSTMELLGVSCYTEELLKNSTIFSVAKLMNQIVFAWGKDNNDTKKIKTLKLIGIHGIIYDKISFLIDKHEEDDNIENNVRRTLETKDQVQTSALEIKKSSTLNTKQDSKSESSSVIIN